MSAAPPRVTVLMPVYNGASFLREAMDSILSQSFADFEFLIINDGSTDHSVEIIQSYADPRIRLVSNESNLKLAATLNKGLNLARGEYIARMDCDDISLPERFARQVAFLDAHPEVGICGTFALSFGDAQFKLLHPTDPARIRAKLLFDSALVHPSVVMRRALLEAHQLTYREWYPLDDYELWQRAAECFPIANLPDMLLRYRVTQGSAFFGADRTEQNALYHAIDRKMLPRFGISPTPAELDIHLYLRRMGGDRMDEAHAWLLKLRDTNRQTHFYDDTAFADILRERWFLVCFQTPAWGLRRWLRYVRSPLYGNNNLPLLNRLKTFVKFQVQPLRARLGV